MSYYSILIIVNDVYKPINITFGGHHLAITAAYINGVSLCHSVSSLCSQRPEVGARDLLAGLSTLTPAIFGRRKPREFLQLWPFISYNWL